MIEENAYTKEQQHSTSKNWIEGYSYAYIHVRYYYENINLYNYIWSYILSSFLDAMLTLSKTTSPPKVSYLIASHCKQGPLYGHITI